MKKALVVFCILGFSATSLAQQIEWMELMNVDAGWAATHHDLFWTTNGGRDWRNVTPTQIARDKQISGVFFLDAFRGWVVLSRYDNDADTTYFWLASTVDAGANWAVKRIDIPEWYNSSQPAILNDSELSIHFWNEREGLIGVSGGGFALTSDAGKTWRLTATPGLGELLFTSRNDGWLLGASAKYEYNGKLFVTHDGSKNWHEVTLPGLPKPEEANLNYDLPMFADKGRGFLTVRYYGPKTNGIAVYSTTDGGRRWRRDYTLPYDGNNVVFTVRNSQMLVATVNDHRLNLYQPFSTPSGGGTVDPFIANVVRVRFIDSSHGWAMAAAESGGEQLLSTANGGATWVNISPTHKAN